MINRLTLPEVCFFIESHLEAGIMPTEIFKTLSRRYKKYESQFALVAKDISTGKALARSLKDAGLFNDVDIEQIHAGEKSGNLAEAFQNIGESSERGNDVAKKLKGILRIPVITFFLSFYVAIVFMGVLIPKIAGSLSIKDPNIVIKTSMEFSALVNEQYWVYALIAGLFILMGYLLFTSEKVVESLSNSFSKTQLLQEYYFAQWSNLVSMLQRSGIDMALSVKLSNGLLPGDLSRATEHVFGPVLSGKSNYGSVLDESKFVNGDPRYLIPDIVRASILSGANTGLMDKSLEKSSKHLFKQFNYTVDVYSDILKVAIVPAIAVPIVLIALAFIDVISIGF